MKSEDVKSDRPAAVGSSDLLADYMDEIVHHIDNLPSWPWKRNQIQEYVAWSMKTIPTLIGHMERLRNELFAAMVERDGADKVIANLKAIPAGLTQCPKCGWHHDGKDACVGSANAKLRDAGESGVEQH